MNLLALLRRVPPRADPPCEADDAVAVWEVPGLYRWEGPDRLELVEEDRLLDRVAGLANGGAMQPPRQSDHRPPRGAPMTPEQIEHREYSYCAVTYQDPLRWERFLVAATGIRQAVEDARAYATERWGEPADVRVFPRNYVREARRLLAEGRYEGALPEPENNGEQTGDGNG